MMDLDGSGEISLGEFKKALFELKMDYLQEEEVHHLFNLFDSNRSGTISYQEFLTVVTVSNVLTNKVGRSWRFQKRSN